MVSLTTKLQMSLAEFLQLPETKPASEYIDGEIYQKSMPQAKHSRLQKYSLEVISQAGETQELVCAFPELRCTFGGRSIVPDIAVFEWGRIPVDADGEITNKIEIHPDWVIEILSPEQSPNLVIKKIVFCLEHGTKLGWFIDPNDKSVMILAPHSTPIVLSDDEILPVLPCLADWQFSATQLFSCLKFKK